MQYDAKNILEYARLSFQAASVALVGTGLYKSLLSTQDNSNNSEYYLGSIAALTVAHFISQYQENKLKQENLSLRERNKFLASNNDLLEDIITEDISSKTGIKKGNQPHKAVIITIDTTTLQ